MSDKIALVTGCSGMDGSHMVDLLLCLGYEVYGVSTGISQFLPINHKSFYFNKIDIRDYSKISDLIHDRKIKEVFNFAAITFAPEAEKNPELTLQINRDAPINIAKICEKKNIKFIQASSSEIFGDVSNQVVEEMSLRNPSSFYAKAKFEVDEAMGKMRREGSPMYNAILFPHESERRKSNFLIRKVCHSVAKISRDQNQKIELGNLDSSRDWSSSKDFVKWIQLLSNHQPDEYVLSSGSSHSAGQVLDIAFSKIGISDWKDYVIQKEEYLRPDNKNNLTGNSQKLKNVTGYSLNIGFKQMIHNIIDYDLKNLNR
jgi:GDPmannose 4,6-dehydratase